MLYIIRRDDPLYVTIDGQTRGISPPLAFRKQKTDRKQKQTGGQKIFSLLSRAKAGMRYTSETPVGAPSKGPYQYLMGTEPRGREKGREWVSPIRRRRPRKSGQRGNF